MTLKKWFIYQSLVVVALTDHLPLARAAVEYAWFILETKHFHIFLCWILPICRSLPFSILSVFFLPFVFFYDGCL